MTKATARAGSNIAFIKYWGVADATINLPLSNSISMTLADAYTETTVEWLDQGESTTDRITLDGTELQGAAADRIVRHLDRVRKLGETDRRARLVSRNNFPTASGIASSASGFAALTVAATAALGLDLTETELSTLSRRGSGSASRSIAGGFVEWETGHDHESSAAHQMFGPEHWQLYDIVAVVSSASKHVSSAQGHRLAATSPLLNARVDSAKADLPAVRQAIAERDLATLGPIIERDALAMHSVMMTSTPPLFYWQPGTMEILNAVYGWRDEGIAVYFTIDAGPNVHLICEPEHSEAVQKGLAELSSVQRVITSRPGQGAKILQTDLF